MLRTLVGGGELAISFAGGVAICPDGSIALTDYDGHRVLRVRTVAGAATMDVVAGARGQPGHATGAGAAARFYYPAGIAALRGGTLVIAEGGLWGDLTGISA